MEASALWLIQRWRDGKLGHFVLDQVDEAAVDRKLSPDEEKPTLDKWAREQDTTPWLRFSTADAGSSDPGNLTEAVGDADAVEATRLGIKNLERVANMLLEATTYVGPFAR